MAFSGDPDALAAGKEGEQPFVCLAVSKAALAVTGKDLCLHSSTVF